MGKVEKECVGGLVGDEEEMVGGSLEGSVMEDIWEGEKKG